MLWFRLLGMAWKQKFLCFGLSYKWAKWVKVSRISTKDLSRKLLLTETKKFIKREEGTNQTCAYYISVAFWWLFGACLVGEKKRSSFLLSLFLLLIRQNCVCGFCRFGLLEGGLSPDRQTGMTWFVLLDQHCPTSSGWYGNAAVWSHSHAKALTQVCSQSFALSFRKQSERKRKHDQGTHKHVYLVPEVFGG